MDQIKHSVELNLYSDVKTKFGHESYISQVQYYKYKRAITKVRISAHSLPTERGQWDKTKRKERFCPLCTGDSIGNEQHWAIAKNIRTPLVEDNWISRTFCLMPHGFPFQITLLHLDFPVSILATDLDSQYKLSMA